MKYLLDTDICIYFLKQNKKIVEKLQDTPEKDLAISVITVAELQFGAFNSKQTQNNLKKVEAFQDIVQTIILTPEITAEYARIKAELRQKGLPVADFDILIGATALVNGLILVTNNTQHFARLPNLPLENWSADLQKS
jgi:tRNA(fMet)-specific endonuclease VapC